MNSVEGVGKNIEQAIENALFELKASREDVDIKILSEGGLFKKAKVLVSISEDAKEKYIKKEEVKKNIIEEADGLVIDKTVKSVSNEVEKTKKEEKKEDIDKEDKIKKENKIIEPKEFLSGLFKTAGKEVKIDVLEDEEKILFSITGDDLNNYIGYRGEALFSISFLTSILAGKTDKRVIVDIENYREKRVAALTSLANRIASKVAKTGRYAKLEPMDASERRIIHLALQENEQVTTLSKGTEPHRYIMVFPREYKNN